MEALGIVTPDGTRLHVGRTGTGPDVLVLSGGPGCVHYLEDERLVPDGITAWFPEPRGVGRSGGGPHDLAQAVDDLEAVRAAVGVAAWTVLGHSWGSDLAVRYALDRPSSLTRVVGVAGHGLHKDRSWSQVYEAGKQRQPGPEVAWEPAVWQALNDSFLEWIHEPTLFRRLADTTVPMTFVAAGDDIRPSWPLRQLAALVPSATYDEVPDVPHDFWASHPDTWVEVVSRTCHPSSPA